MTSWVYRLAIGLFNTSPLVQTWSAITGYTVLSNSAAWVLQARHTGHLSSNEQKVMLRVPNEKDAIKATLPKHQLLSYRCNRYAVH